MIKRSVSAPEMSTFKDETTLNISANFKTSMKELKVMKQRIVKPEPETEVRKSFPTKHRIYDDPQSMQTDMPAEKKPSWTGQEHSENNLVLVEQPQKAGIKYPIFPRRKKTKKIVNPRISEAVIERLKQPSKFLKRFSLINEYCLFKEYILICSCII